MPDFLESFVDILLWTLWIFLFVAYLFVLFRMLPTHKAIIWTILGGYLLLPERTGIDLPLLGDIVVCAPLVADEAAQVGIVALGLQHLAPDEAPVLRLPGDGPGQPCLQGRSRFVHIGTVEIHPRLQPQRIPCSQSARRNASGDQLIPEVLSGFS